MPNGEWDVFGWQLGCGMPISWFDVDAIIALLDDPATSKAEIDRLIIGWDGMQENVWPFIRAMLRARGMFYGNSAEGKITFARVRLATVLDAFGAAATITPIPRVLKIQPSEGEGVDRIVGTFEKSPWSEGHPFEINILSDADTTEPSNSLRGSLFAEKTQVEMDLSVLNAPADSGAGLVSLGKFRAFGAPFISIRANDPENISTGTMLKIGDPGLKESWFVDQDGAAIEVNDDARWFGQVISFDRKIVSGTIDLVLMMNNWHHNKFALLRAPSAVIASGTDPLTLTPTFNADGSSGDDAAEFNEGDDVALWRPDGVRRSGTSGAPDVRTIVGVPSGNSINLSSAFTTPPVAGDILRLAHLDDVNGYPEGGNPTLGNLLAYTYMSEFDETLGPNDLDAHIYAFGILT